jgi:threonyl-tRNA synthetase
VVVGEKEAENGTVAVRKLGERKPTIMTIVEFLAQLS